MTSRFKTAVWLRFGVATLAISLALVGFPNRTSAGPVASLKINPRVVHVPFFIQDAAGHSPATPNTPLYEARLHHPIMAPDGHQVTLDEFNRVSGTALAQCTSLGTQVTVFMNGLIPNGVYTIWNVTFKAPGFVANPNPNIALANVIGVGALGPSNGSRNSFRASSVGTATLTATAPGGPLSMVGRIGHCALTDEVEWHLVAAYHLDGRTHGGNLGPDGSAIEQFGWMTKTP